MLLRPSLVGFNGGSKAPPEFLGAANATTGTSSGSGSMNLTTGAPTFQDDDICIGLIGNASTSGTGVPALPTGWTDSGLGAAAADGNVCNLRIIWRKVVSGSLGGSSVSYSITSHTNANRVAAARAYFFRGLDLTNPIRDMAFSLTGLYSTGPWDTPNVEPNVGDFCMFGSLVANDVLISSGILSPYSEATTDMGGASSTSGSDIGLSARRRTTHSGLMTDEDAFDSGNSAKVAATFASSPAVDGILFSLALKAA